MSKYAAEAAEIKEAARYQPIKVLVWGPGDPGPGASAEAKAGYQKRLQIRAVLRDRFPCAEVYFSEDAEMIQLTEGLGGQLLKEAVQARLSDLVIMLDLGRGVDLELDHYIPTYDWFPRRVFLLVPKKYVDTKGLVREILDYLLPHQIMGFTPEEFEVCTVAKEMAVAAALATALDRALKR